MDTNSTGYFNLRQLRNSLNITQAQLAEILGVPQSSVSSMEKGRTRVSLEYIKILEERFGINRRDFENDEPIVYVQNSGNKGGGYCCGTNTGYKNTLKVQQVNDQVQLAAQEIIVKTNADLNARVAQLEQKIQELTDKNQEQQNTICDLRMENFKLQLSLQYATKQ